MRTKQLEYDIKVLENEVIWIRTPDNTVYVQAFDVDEIFAIHSDFAHWGVTLVYKTGEEELFKFDDLTTQVRFLDDILPLLVEK